MLTPPGTVEPDPSIISPRRVRNFVRTVAPGTPDPRLDALVALEEEHGTSGLTGDPVSDAEGARTCGPYLSVDAKGRLSLRTRSIHRPPYEDAHLFEDPFSDSEPLFMDHDPLYDTDPLFDVVDVPCPSTWRRPPSRPAPTTGSYTYGEGASAAGTTGCSISRNASPFRPLEAAQRVGFPGRIPARIPLVGPRPEPSMIRMWGRDRRASAVGPSAWWGRS